MQIGYIERECPLCDSEKFWKNNHEVYCSNCGYVSTPPTWEEKLKSKTFEFENEERPEYSTGQSVGDGAVYWYKRGVSGECPY